MPLTGLQLSRAMKFTRLRTTLVFIRRARTTLNVKYARNALLLRNDVSREIERTRGDKRKLPGLLI